MVLVLFFSFKKSNLLGKIARESQKQRDPKALMEMLDGKRANKKQEYIKELLNLLSKDSYTTDLLSKHGRTFDDLLKIIKLLEATGAGQVIRGHYVPVSSIAFLGQLRDILEHWNGEHFVVDDLDTQSSNLKISQYLLHSFQ